MNCGCHSHRFEEIKQKMVDAWNEINRIAESYDSMDAIDTILFEERLRDSWYIPQKIMRNHQVLSRKPIVSHIRNNI